MSDIGTTVGLIKALAPKPTAEDITTAVDAWLDDHPEATTTVEDGAISYAKLDASLQGTVDDVSDLKTEIDYLDTAIALDQINTGMWANGGLSAANGTTTTHSTSIRTEYIPDNLVKITPNSGYKVQIHAYNRTTSAYIGVWNGSGYQTTNYWFTGETPLINVLKDYKVRIVGRTTSETSITVDVAADKFTFTFLQSINGIKDIMFGDDDAILARNGLTAAIAYPQCYIPVVFAGTNAGLTDMRSNLVSLTGTNASITFKNTSGATVNLRIVTSSSDGTDSGSDVITNVNPGDSHTFTSSTRQYLKIRLIKSGSSFTADEIKSLSLCSYVLDTTLQADLLKSKITFEDYASIAARLEGDEHGMSDINKDIVSVNRNANYVADKIAIPFYFGASNVGQNDIRSAVVGLSSQKGHIYFKNTTNKTIKVLVVNSSSDGTDSGSTTIETVSAGGSCSYYSQTRQYLKLRLKLDNDNDKWTYQQLQQVSNSAYVIDDAVETAALVSTINSTKYDTIAKRLSADESYLSEFVHQYDIPSYFDDNLAAAITAVRANTWSVGIHGTNFVWITDTHWEHNEKHSPNLIRKIIKQTNVSEVLCGGDIIDYGSRADMIPICYAHMQAFDFVKNGLKLTFGNHDANQNNNTQESGNIFTKDEVYAIEYLPIEDIAHFGDYFDYYFDVPATKTRYIALTTFWNASGQATWLTNLLAASTDWNIVVYTHAIWTTNETDIPSSTQALLTILDTNNATNHNVKAIMTGHLHLDKIGYTAGGIPIVGTDTDNRSNLSPNNPNTATVGTITEQAFDIVSVDYTGDIIRCVRVGRGKSRTINAEAVSISAGNTDTLTTDLTSPSWSTSDSSVATVSDGVVTAVASGSAVISADGTDGQEFWNIVVA